MTDLPDSPDRASFYREAVLDIFRHLPRLDFSHQPEPLTFDFPGISQPEGFGHRTAPTSELREFARQATDRLLYNDFFDPRMAAELCWSGEYLETVDGKFEVRTQTRQIGKRALNETQEAARDWFRRDIVGDILKRRLQDTSCRILLGHPGSGKSTLLKYLINAERSYCQNSAVVFSRFELTKFTTYVGERLRTETNIELKENEVLRLQQIYFKDYLNAIVLRDILFNYTLAITDRGTLQPDPWGFGGHREIADLIERALSRSYSQQEVNDIFERLTDHIGERSFKFEALTRTSLISPSAVEAILAEVVKVVNRHVHPQALRVCVLYDGFDLIGPEDYHLDSRRFHLLCHILGTYDLLTPGANDGLNPILYSSSVKIAVPFSQHAMILLRHNTYELLVNAVDAETFRRDLAVYEIALLSPDVVLLRSIKRGLANGSQVPTTPEQLDWKAEQIFGVLSILLQRLGDFQRTDSSRRKAAKLISLNLFDSNLRDCMEIVRRMLELIAEEGRIAGRLPERPTVDDLIKFAGSVEGLGIARQRSYRSVEVLLFFGRPLFRNAIRAELAVERGVTEVVRLHKDQSHTGLIDNIFNYHSARAKGNHGHYLLSKIRILQAFNTDGALSDSQISDTLRRYGYDPATPGFFEEAMNILRHTGMLAAETFPAMSFTRTTRGKGAVERFLFETDYLEHIFHATLFPTALIGDESDYVRGVGHEKWAISAIRNYFILLSYIKFVEEVDTITGGILVPEEWRLTQRLQAAILRAVESIFKAARDEERMAVDARAEIDKTLHRWHTNGIIT